MGIRIALGAVMLVALSAVALPIPSGYRGRCPGQQLHLQRRCYTGPDPRRGHSSIPSGDYASITVTGVCNIVPGAVINVSGNINVAPGAALDAQSAPSTITVGHNVTAGAVRSSAWAASRRTRSAGSRECRAPIRMGTGYTTITINGNVTATDASTVLLIGAVAPGAGKLTVNGNVTVTGGSSDTPWSIKGVTIGRNLTVSGVTAEFFGVQFTTIGDNATLTNITVNDVHSPPPGCRCRGKHGREEPQLHWTRPRRIRQASSAASSTTSVTKRPVSAQRSFQPSEQT